MNKFGNNLPIGHEDKETSDLLQNGQSCIVIGVGNSMLPILKSRQPVVVSPVSEETEIKQRDIVFCKVRGHYYVHLVHKIRGNGQFFQIGNNRGRINGWVPKSQIFGKVTEILPLK